MAGPDLLLIHPPAARPAEPPLGTAVLLSHLRREGAAAEAIDANLEAYLHLLDADRLAASADRAPATALRRAVRNVPRALSFLRSPEAGTSLPRYTAAARHLNTALTSYRGGSGRERLTLGDYVHGGLSEFSPRDLSLVAGGEAGTVFSGYFRDALLPRVERMRPRGIAISVNYRHQVLPAFELAGLLRRLLPGVPVFGGGGMFTSWRRALRTMDSAFLPFDGIGFGPGESALAALAAGASVGGGVFFEDGEAVEFLPDFGFAPLRKYFSPGPVLPVSATRGCYWRRCRFCPEAVAPTHPYRAAGAGGFPALVRKLSGRYGEGAARRRRLGDPVEPLEGGDRRLRLRDARRPGRDGDRRRADVVVPVRACGGDRVPEPVDPEPAAGCVLARTCGKGRNGGGRVLRRGRAARPVSAGPRRGRLGKGAGPAVPAAADPWRPVDPRHRGPDSALVRRQPRILFPRDALSAERSPSPRRRSRRGSPGGALSVQHHPGVRDGEPPLVHDDRVEVHLLDLRVRGEERGHLAQERAQGAQVRRRLSAQPGQRPVSTDLRNHLRGVPFGERRHPERYVLHHLDEDPPETEHHGVAELLIPRHADDHLLSRGRHRAYQRPAGPGAEPSFRVPDRPERRADARLVRHVQEDATRIALVGHIRGVHLHRHREADPPRPPRRFLLAARPPEPGQREPGAGEELHRVGGRDRPGRDLRCVRRFLRGEREPAAVETDVAGECLHGPFRRREYGDLLLVEPHPLLAFHIRAPQVRHQLAPPGPDHLGGSRNRVPEDRHHHVVFPVGRIENAPVTGRVGVPGEIEGVADDAMGGEDLPELPGEGGGERGDAKPLLLRDVRGDDGGPPGAGDDERPRTLGGRDVGERLGEIVQLLQRGRAVHAVLPEHGFVDLAPPRQRPGVGLRGLASPLGPPRLEDHHRLGAGADGGEELRGVLHPLDVEGDHLRVRILPEETDQVRLVHVGPVPHADEGGKPESFLRRPVDERRADRAALRDDRDFSPAGDQRPRGAHAVVRIVHPLAVGTDHPDASRLRRLRHLRLEGRPRVAP